MNINDLLGMSVARGASDLHLKTGSPPALRINGELNVQDDMGIITPEEMTAIFFDITTEAEREEFARELETDFAYEAKDIGRFRINICRQIGTIGLSCRPILTDMPTIEGLGLPAICKELAMKNNGLVIVTGPTGCGKSTTLAAMINHLNQTVKRKIVAIGDPVEFIHRDNKCIFTQREIGKDTRSFANALKHAMRQNPDVILVDEMRDLETMSAVLTAAETGHLVLTTLHTPGTPESIDRFIDVFPPYQQQQVRVQLSLVLEGILYQLLLPRRDGPGRVAAVEIMLATPPIRNLIREGKTFQMMNTIQTSKEQGMQSLNHALAALFNRGMITREQAMARSMEQEDLTGMLHGQKA
ncbi:MAG: PilT/PilU family type 4a pilus ATPase [Dehalococcoidales bacterium]|jgi:twitching motility protein PilT